jgi:hypothetical protein
MISVAVDICRFIIDQVNKENELKFDERLRIASVLSEISIILFETADMLRRDVYPHQNCVVLEKLSDKLHFHLIDMVNANELDKLHEELIKASNIEKSYHTRKDPTTISEIESAAGEFKALSMLMKF